MVQLIEIVREIGSGLHGIHTKGYAHNDIKAENIVMYRRNPDVENATEPEYIAKIIDFEFASHPDLDFPEGLNNVAGTRAYYSPEKSSNVNQFDRQLDDMWALGVTIHLAQFGCFPNGTGAALPILTQDFKAPEDTDANVAHLLENLLKINPEERWKASQVVQYAELAQLGNTIINPVNEYAPFGLNFAPHPVAPPAMSRYLKSTSVLSNSPVTSPMVKNVDSPTRSSMREFYDSICNAPTHISGVRVLGF